ncbi:hypothetical protein M3181_21360 [Mesobacillus maritimus]|uniref:hypothetical protein n=1 Tax=Mesobacillus maritimus TaxID=1643336 RepID=UPI00203A4362|nr:hypothetical protein [Mesobacillus maritimus]MCM3671511.1 hypothetical protein [Mesobacillus maritimus]
MYPSHAHLYNQEPYQWDPYLSSSPYQENIPYSADVDERQFGQMFPPIGLPPGPPGSQPPFGPPGQGQAGGPPTSPPPSFVPAQTQQVGTFAVDPGGIRRCLFRYTYVWLRGFEQFWFYPIFVGRNSVAGWRWTGYRWVYFGISLRQIQSFTCV